jgi:hypothetical protein
MSYASDTCVYMSAYGRPCYCLWIVTKIRMYQQTELSFNIVSHENLLGSSRVVVRTADGETGTYV